VTLLRQGVWTRWPTEVPSNPYYSVILWFLELGKKIPTCFAPLSWNSKCIHKASRTLQETQPEMGYVEKQQHRGRGRDAPDDSAVTVGSAWPCAQLPRKHRVVRAPGKAPSGSEPSPPTWSSNKCSKQGSKLACECPELLSSYHRPSLPNAEQNPLKLALLKQEQKIQRKYFMKNTCKKYYKASPKNCLTGGNVSAWKKLLCYLEATSIPVSSRNL